MKYWIRTVFIFFFQFFCVPNVSSANDVCLGDHQQLKKLSNRFEDMRKNNRDEFWAILLEAETRAMNCQSTSNIVVFLKLANKKTIDVEFLEYYSEAIEKLCMEKPQKFKLATNKLCSEQKIAVKSLLAAPLYHDVVELQVCQ